MKDRKCFNYKEKGYIMLNYLEKARISIISGTLDKNNIEYIN